MDAGHADTRFTPPHPALAPAEFTAALTAGARTALARSRFVAHAATAALGPDADEAQRVEWLLALAAGAWTAERQQATLASLVGSGERLQAVPAALRRLRRQVLLGTIVRDVAGVAPLAEVTESMTALAELAVRQLLPLLAQELADSHGAPHSAEGIPQDLLVVAMGKAGGRELNVSSDLDLIFVYDAEGETRPTARHGGVRSVSNQEFFERLARRLAAGLSDVTAEGFVFRVDLRLRPNGDSGPLVVSASMLEEYLIRQGREWERFAWLKGCVISEAVFADAAQFQTQCKALNSLVTPFVFRKYLDFNAIASLRELHALIRAETQKKSARRAGGSDDHENNVKLGRGGIREIEFIAQTFQIIRGGREPRLRDKRTLVTLATLADVGALPVDTCARLAAAYAFLRQLEHALQYLDDAQTHLLPAAPEARAAVAALLRLPDADALWARYAREREFVAATFDAIFLKDGGAPAEATPAAWDEASLFARLQSRGYGDAAASADRIRALLASRRVLAASEAVRGTIERLLSRAIDAIAEAAGHSGSSHDVGPDAVLARLLRLLDVIAGRSTYIALLNQYPQAFARVLRLLSASAWATDYLLLHPILLDELLDERLHERDPELSDWPRWADEVRAQLVALDEDVERQMNVLRDAHHAQVFRLLVADLDGRLTVERLADHLSLLADQAVGLALERAWASLSRRHAEVSRFAVIGFGKLGGKELGYASDLDLIYLYDDPHPDAPENYALLARRLINWLTAQTSSGTLFDIDLRLRPNGNAGLLVSSIEAFEQYERNEDRLGAWTWEHQALTRARFCCGYAPLGERFKALRNEILARARDHKALCADVLEMRRKMLEGHPNRSALFDLKHDRGGMVDIEFIVQMLVLAHAHGQPRLLGNLGNIALLRIAAELGLIDAELARRNADAYRDYRRIQHRLRLNGAEYARVEPAEVAQQRADVLALWRAVFGTELPQR